MPRSDHAPVARFGQIRVLVLSHDSRFVGVLRLLLDRSHFAVRVAGRHDRVADLVARSSDVVVVDATHARSDPARAVDSVRMRWPDIEPVVVSDDEADPAGALHKWGPPQQLLTAIERAYHGSATRLGAPAPRPDRERREPPAGTL
jgi:DNA-binding NarL/FixJ family response regulator